MVAVVLLFGLAAGGCGIGGRSGAENASSEREVVSEAGKTVRIPTRPERMVVDWITFDNLIALDVSLASVAGVFDLEDVEKDPDRSPFMAAKAKEAGVSVVGEAFKPRYEAIGALKPDLFVLAKDQTTDEVVAKLEAIAPVVVYTVPDGRRSFDDWRSSLKRTAALLELDGRAEAYVSSYDRRVAAFRASHPDVVDDLEATVGAINNGKITVSMYKRNLGTNVIDELGLVRPAAQRKQKVNANQSFDVSPERVDLLDADVIFLEQRQADINSLTGNPQSARLEAVKAGRVHFVRNYWQTGGAGSAVHVLDDAIAALTEK